MAFTKNPVLSTDKKIRLPIAHSANTLSSAFVEKGPKYLNCGPVKISQFGTDPERAVVPRPAFCQVGTLPNQNLIRAVSFCSVVGNPITSMPITVAVLGNTAYISNDSAFASPTNIGTLQYSTGHVGITQYTVGTTTYLIFLETHATASYIHTYNVNGGAWTSTNLTFGTSGDPVFLDGYIFIAGTPFVLAAASQRIYNSSISSPTVYVPANDFLDAEMYPDRILFLAKHHNHLVAFGERSIEFFYNGANQLGSPLSRQPSYAVEIGGLLALDETNSNNHRPAYVYVGNDLYFMGKTPTGQLGVYVVSDFQVKKISDRFMDRVLNPLNGLFYGPQTSARLFAIPSRGQTQVVLQYSRGSNSSTIGSEVGTSVHYVSHYAFNPQENEWSEWFIDDDYDTYDANYTPSYTTSDSYFIQGVSNATYYPIYFIKKIVNSGGTTTNAVYNQFFSEHTSSYPYGTVYSEIIFPVTDLGQQQYKHIKYVDILGDFHPNSLITLEYTTDTNMSSYKEASAVNTDSNGPRRIRNITRARNVGFKVRIASQEPYMFTGLDVAYDLGST